LIFGKDLKRVYTQRFCFVKGIMQAALD